MLYYNRSKLPIGLKQPDIVFHMSRHCTGNHPVGSHEFHIHWENRRVFRGRQDIGRLCGNCARRPPMQGETTMASTKSDDHEASYDVTPEQQKVERWNAGFPVGTPVRYWPIRKRLNDGFDGEPHDGVTRSEAWMIGDKKTGHASVLVTGKRGGLLLDHLQLMEATS